MRGDRLTIPGACLPGSESFTKTIGREFSSHPKRWHFYWHTAVPLYTPINNANLRLYHALTVLSYTLLLSAFLKVELLWTGSGFGHSDYSALCLWVACTVKWTQRVLNYSPVFRTPLESAASWEPISTLSGLWIQLEPSYKERLLQTTLAPFKCIKTKKNCPLLVSVWK